MKKIITTVLLALMLLSLCACDNNKGNSGKAPASGSNLSWEQIEKRAEKEMQNEG